MGRKAGVAILLVAIIAGVVTASYLALAPREEPLPSGPLTQALLAYEGDETRRADLDSIFARFVSPTAPLKDRVPTLIANGFRCSLAAANVDGSTILSCTRPTEGTGYCRGFIYYAYETATGEILETRGTNFEADRNADRSGQCDNNRSSFLALPLPEAQEGE